MSKNVEAGILLKNKFFTGSVLSTKMAIAAVNCAECFHET